MAHARPQAALAFTLLLPALVFPVLLAIPCHAQEILPAAEQGDLETVRSLLAANPALVSAADDRGYTVLHKAAYNNHADVAELLIAAGADVNAMTSAGSTPLHGAAFGGHLEVVRLLLDHGAALEAANRGGFTPLLSACAGGRAEVAHLLIERGADIRAVSSGGMTALIHAVNSQSLKTVALLLENGANVNAAADDGQTPLGRALWSINRPITALLLARGADVDLPTSQGVSLAYFAVAYRDSSLGNLLIDAVTAADERNPLQLTMLHYASARGFLNQVEALVARGADVHARCTRGRAPLYYATIWGQTAAADFLRAHGADAKEARADWPAGPYFGQPLPGRAPQVFAENLLITPFTPHGSLAISPDGREVFWCHQAQPIRAMWHVRREGDAWRQPEIAPFTDPALDYGDGGPSFSADGSRLFFHSQRPVDGAGARREDSDIWFVQRTPTGWGRPVHLAAPVNSEHEEYNPVIAASGNLYFVGEGYPDSRGAGDLYVAELRAGAYLPPRNLGPAINTEGYEITPAVAPDESYVIFASDRPTMWGRDIALWASFRRADRTWSDAIDLGRHINTGRAWHPFISADGAVVFYLQNDNYRWFSAAFMEDLRDAVIGRGHEALSIARVPVFVRSTQTFDPVYTPSAALGDLDGDGDLDAVCANMRFNESRVWLNDGRGQFTATDQPLSQQGHGVDLGDLDGDGDLDIFLTCADYGENNIWYHRPSRAYFNNGHARFTPSAQDLGDSLLSGTSVVLQDVDSDGDLDAAVTYHQADNRIYLNDGQAHFTLSTESFPEGAAWGDLDGDGDVDLLVGEAGIGYRSLLNDGAGVFQEHWRLRDSTLIRCRIALGDLDRDGDADAVVGSGDNSGSQPSSVWLNDGTGRFTAIETDLPITRWPRLALGDLNGDGWLDAFASSFDLPAAVWWNDGRGYLVDTGTRLATGGTGGECPLGDLDGDGDLDAFLADFAGGSNQVWFNGAR